MTLNAKTIEISGSGGSSATSDVSPYIKQDGSYIKESDAEINLLLKPLARALAKVHFPATDAAGHPNLTGFFLDHGRLPHITDEIKPWKYKGWLLAYVVEIQRVHPDITDRWGYYFRTVDAGRLLDEPVPQVNFHGEFVAQVNVGKRELEKWELIVSRERGVWDGFRVLVDWLAWALGVASEPAPLTDKINEELYRQVNIGPWLLAPSDYLGSYLAERKAGGWNPNAFFPTPHTVVEAMVRMTFEDPANSAKDARRLKTMDPCVGTGRMLLHASNYCLRLYGQDIDPLVVKICKINGALYAPWLAFPLPEEIFAETNCTNSEINCTKSETNCTKSETNFTKIENFSENPVSEEIAASAPIQNVAEDVSIKKETFSGGLRRRRVYRTNEDQGLLFELD